MPIITHPNAPSKEEALVNAQAMAENLRALYPGLRVRIDEAIGCYFKVVVEVPFRVEQPTWQERAARGRL